MQGALDNVHLSFEETPTRKDRHTRILYSKKDNRYDVSCVNGKPKAVKNNRNRQRKTRSSNKHLSRLFWQVLSLLVRK